MTHTEATVLANFLDQVLPGTESREVMVSWAPQSLLPENCHICVAEDGEGGAKSIEQLNTFHEVYDYMKVRTAMRISPS